jgi:CRP-like cAMP-binding protein
MESFLARLPLFAGLTSADLSQLEQRMPRRDYLPQSVIVREGTAADAAFVVLSGQVAVRRKDPASGIEFHLSEIGPDQMFGEMGLLTSKPRTASVVAVEATTCAVLDRTVFEQMMRALPAFGLAITSSLAERLDRANQHAGVEFVNLSRAKIDPRVLGLLPSSIVAEHKVVPIAYMNNRLTLAMTNPNNVVAFDDVRRIVRGVLIEPVIVTEDDFKRFMSTTYAQLTAKQEPEAAGAPHPAVRPAPSAASASVATVDLLQSDLMRELQLTADTDAGEETKQDLMSASEDAPIIKLANSILGLGIKQGVSDIHIEPMEQDVTVRFRIDGVLQVVQRLPKKVQLVASEESREARHLREAAATGRPHQCNDGGESDRLQGVHRAGQVGREGVHAHSRQVEHRARPGHADLARADARAGPRDDRAAIRHRVRDRPDRIREDDDAVFSAGRDQRSRREHLNR